MACIASGPSLLAEDCLKIREAGLPTIAVNCAFRLAPWADVLFAMDAGWWQQYGAEVSSSGFCGERWGYMRHDGVRATKHEIYPTGWGNSGTYAISLAVVSGASQIFLLGYDGGWEPGGPLHFHANHPDWIGNPTDSDRWQSQAELIAVFARKSGVIVTNCSRKTYLKCFERRNLETELERWKPAS